MDDSALPGVSFAENVKEGQKVEWEAEVSRHMPVRVSVNTDSLRRLNRALADIDPNLRKEVGRDIKDAIRPTAARIKSRIPSQPPLSGMRHSGRTAWRGVNVGAYATPGGGRGSIARFEVYGRGQYKAGVKIADLAGTRGRYVRGPRGRKFIDNLNRRYPLSMGGKGGRFAWQNFMKEKPFLVDQVLEIIDGFVTKVNRRGLK